MILGFCEYEDETNTQTARNKRCGGGGGSGGLDGVELHPSSLDMGTRTEREKESEQQGKRKEKVDWIMVGRNLNRRCKTANRPSHTRAPQRHYE
jgi:hypothetical protein